MPPRRGTIRYCVWLSPPGVSLAVGAMNLANCAFNSPPLCMAAVLVLAVSLSGALVGVFLFEDALECVIILLRNGIELVIVTTRATGGEPWNTVPVVLIMSSSSVARPCGRVQVIALSRCRAAQRPESPYQWVRPAHRRQLLAHKLVVWLIFIKREITVR